ncbi:hypothetical protein B0A55_10533 [Friedmanniomyces simplex]|uniref:Uncharacterized protein n=1 Tax=Friedmanniomyces simplex TaxID=329884 RepID=A0A4U0WMA1_9PEZI|nr:hypothetical protein B0A55_10533 [Friedmanniomyces simplex]
MPSLTCDDVPLLKDGLNSDKYRREERSSRLWLIAWWAPEIVASLLSIALFASIVGILRKFEGRGISEINLPHITLNGFIAALATLNRAFLVAPLGSAVMQELWLFYAAESRKKTPTSRLIDLKAYDEASRNAWGAIKPLAFAAALAIVASLAFGTSLQQILSFASLVPVAAESGLLPGNLPRSESWTAVYGSPSQNINTSYPPFDLIAAVYDGVLGGGASLFNFSYPDPQLWPGFQVVSGNGGHFNGSIDHRMYIANFDMIGAPYVADPDAYYQNIEVAAWECALWISIRDQQIKPYTFLPVPIAGNTSIEFLTSQHAVDTLAHYFRRSFNGVAYLDQNTAQLSSDLIAGIWNGTTDPQGWIENVATSMSNVVRATNASTRVEYDGNAYQLGVDGRIVEAGIGRLSEYRGPEKSVGRARVRLERRSGKSWALNAC